jgi:hypothetical protein
MANADVIYAIAVQGAQDAINAFNSVGAASKAPKDSASTWTKFSGSLDHVSDSAKKVARDMDATGNKIAESSLKAIDNVTGLASAIAMGPFSLVGAIGLVAGGWAIYNNYANKAEELNKRTKASLDALASSTRALAEQQVNLNDADEKQLKHREDVTALVIESNALTLQGMNLNLMGFRMAAAEQKRSLNDLDLNDPTGAVRVAKYQLTMETLADLEAQFTGALKMQEDARTEFTDLRRRRVLAAIKETEAEKVDVTKKGADDEARKFKEGERAFYAVMDARARAYEKDKADKLRAQKESGDILAEAYREIAQDEIDAAKKAADEFEKAAKKKADAAEKAALAFKKMRDELMSVGTAVGVFKNVTAPTFDAGMMVINSATGLANKYLDEFGTINRDNWRDMLSFSKDKQAAFAAEAQAALWSLARQAAPKAIYENAEGIASAAAAAGEYGKGNVAGGVLLTAAAVGHYAASAAYGTIAVAAGGGSLAIGAARGKGGLVAASPGGGGGGMSAGPGASPRSGGGGGFTGGGGSSTPGGGSVNITYVYEAGSINAADERATARTVADGVGNARGSWFERRRMERRV